MRKTRLIGGGSVGGPESRLRASRTTGSKALSSENAQGHLYTLHLAIIYHFTGQLDFLGFKSILGEKRMPKDVDAEEK